MGAVALERVGKSYGTLDVIHDVSFSIEEGEFVVMVGPSGCGKSTLLRMVAGLEHISKGDISIGGQVVNNLEPKDRDIAMVFQNYALYPHMNVADNMSFALRLNGTSKQEIQTRVERAADILGLRPLLDRHPRQLSGGQRQRVAMGRAIVRSPKVFLFDEPLSNLDAKLRVAMRAEIMALHQRLRTTTIYVTHDQVEAMTMADKIIVLQGGRVEQIGSPMDLYDRPRSIFVAGFIGSPAMNLIAGTVTGSAAEVSLVTDDGIRLALPWHARSLAHSMPVIYGIRPEHFTLGMHSSAAFELEVKISESTGAETLIQGQVGSQPVTAVFRDRRDFKSGEKIVVTPDMNKIHLFERSSGNRIEDDFEFRGAMSYESSSYT